MVTSELPSAMLACVPESGKSGSNLDVSSWEAPSEVEVSSEIRSLTEAENPLSDNSFAELPQVPLDDPQTLERDIKEVRRAVQEATEYAPPIVGGQEMKEYAVQQKFWRKRGRGDFNWKRDISRNAQELYKWLLRNMGDTEYLPQHATRGDWDLEAAMEELRRHDVMDENDPNIIRLK